MKPVSLKSQIYTAAFAFHAIHANICTYNFRTTMKEVDCMKPKYQIIIDDIKSYILSGTYK